MTKYNARKVTEDGYTFDSQAEHRRYCTLKIMRDVGLIRDLRVHVPIELAAAVKKTGTTPRISSIVYEADFVYVDFEDDGKPVCVIEDVKGARTPVFNLKLNLLYRSMPMLLMGLAGGQYPIRIDIIDANDV